MDVIPSPQPCAAGEVDTSKIENPYDRSYATAVKGGNQSANEFSKLAICPVSFENGIPTVEFTVEDVNSFTRDEGLHQAVIFKFSYGKPALQDLRQILPKLFEVKGKCNIGQLEYRHILVRFDLFEDFAKVVSRSSGYVQSRGDAFFYRTFPWTMGFNPQEETSKAVVWISLPNLPANLFASKSLLSIASAVGKPIAVDKATKDRTRPSTARVKVLINLLDIHPKKIKIKILDTKSGKMIENDQQIIIDNLPKYCTSCNHQGHDIKSCRWIANVSNGTVAHLNESEDSYTMIDSGRDARELLNEIRAKPRPRRLKFSAKGTSAHLTGTAAKSAETGSVINTETLEGHQFKQDVPVSLHQNSNAQNGKPSVRSNPNEQKVWKPVVDAQHKTVATSVRSHISNAVNKNAADNVKNTKVTLSLKAISLTDFDTSLSNSTYERGSISGVKAMNVQQNSTAKNMRLQIQPDVNDKAKSVMENVVFPKGTELVPHSRKSKDEFMQKGSRPHSTVRDSLVFSKGIDQEVTAMQDSIASTGITGGKKIIVVSSDNAREVLAEVYCCQAEKIDAANNNPVANNEAAEPLIGTCVPDCDARDKLNEISASKRIEKCQQAEKGDTANETIPVAISQDAEPLPGTYQVANRDDQHQSLVEPHIVAKQIAIAGEGVLAQQKEWWNDNQDSASDINDAGHKCKSIVKEDNRVDTLLSDSIGKTKTVVPCTVEQSDCVENRSNCKDQNQILTTGENAHMIDSKVECVHNNGHLGIPESDGQNHFDDQQTTTDSSTSNTKKTVQKYNKQIVTSTSKAVLAMEKMENLNGNKIGGVIKKVNSITPMSISSAYSGEDIIDNEDISSFEETNKQVIISTMKESVIKSKLWDQRHFDDDESWDEGSGGWSSTEEENQHECNSSGEESDTTIKPSAHLSQGKRIGNVNPVASASVLNHNAPIFIPNKSATAYPPMESQTGITQKEQEQNVIISSADKSGSGYGPKNCIFSENREITVSHQSLGMLIPSEQFPIQNEIEGRHIYEEGEEEDILTQCRINAARRGDLSPMHSNPNKKNHRRERSWDDRVVEHATVRKLPMRMAKQKQVTQPLLAKPRKSKNKAS